MPLTINVGLSRKASRDYQSTGVSINVTAELDSALLTKPEDLQQQIDDLYQQAEAAMTRQVNAQSQSARPAAGHERGTYRSSRNGQNSNNNGCGNNGHRNGRSNSGTPGMTVSQGRAIDSIAQRAGLDALQEAQELFGVDLDRLTIRQASELIDHLKNIQTNNNGQNGYTRH